MTQLHRSGERGSARLKFLIVMAILGAVAYAGYLYIPVAYQAYLFKDLMQHNVDVAAALGLSTFLGEQINWRRVRPEYDVPAGRRHHSDAVENNRVEVRVQFTKPIEFPGYTYDYEFDHTAQEHRSFYCQVADQLENKRAQESDFLRPVSGLFDSATVERRRETL